MVVNAENIFILVAILAVVLFVFMFAGRTIEGLENNASGGATVAQANNGIAGNADNFAAQINAQAIKKRDELLISKYKKSYESAIIHAKDLLDCTMLETLLTMDPTNPQKTFEQLAKFGQSQSALEDCMKYLDEQG